MLEKKSFLIDKIYVPTKRGKTLDPDKVVALAEDMLKAAPDALRVTKRSLDATLEIPSFDTAMEMEERGQIQMVRAAPTKR